MIDPNRVVYIDMDGVLFDFDTAAVAGLPEDQRRPRTGFYVAKLYDEPQRSVVQDTYNAPGFFENSPLIDGAIAAWRALLASGYYPRILSAPLSTNPTSVEGKLESLRRHFVPEFGQSVVDEALFDKEKWRYPGLAIIDDRPDIVQGDETGDHATWEHILFGWEDPAFIPDTKAQYRLKSWRDVDELIAILDEIYEKRLQSI